MWLVFVCIGSLEEYERERNTHRNEKYNRQKIDSEKKGHLELNIAAIENNFERENESYIYLNDINWDRGCKPTMCEHEGKPVMCEDETFLTQKCIYYLFHCLFISAAFIPQKCISFLSNTVQNTWCFKNRFKKVNIRKEIVLVRSSIREICQSKWEAEMNHYFVRKYPPCAYSSRFTWQMPTIEEKTQAVLMGFICIIQ